MDEIRRAYNFPCISSLKKAELASELSKLVPSKIIETFYLLDINIYNLLKRIANSPYIPDTGINIYQEETLMHY